MVAVKISVIIPVYNEEETICEILERVLDLKLEKEVIVVDDGSSDGTWKTLTKFAKKRAVLIVRHENNMGKGSAIRTGLKKASGGVIVFQDADLEYSPEWIPKLVQPILNREADVVFGSRFIGRIEGMSLANRIGNRFLTMITRLLYGSNITDMETGYKAFSRSALKNIKLTAKRFEIEPEITAKVLMKGYKIVEIPIDYIARTKGEKKIGIRDGFVALKWLLLFRLTG